MPIAWSERLAAATVDQRSHWELNGDGVGVHWPELDEDLAPLMASQRLIGSSFGGVRNRSMPLPQLLYGPHSEEC